MLDNVFKIAGNGDTLTIHWLIVGARPLTSKIAVIFLVAGLIEVDAVICVITLVNTKSID